MRFAGASAIEIVGGIGVGLCGLLTFLVSTSPVDSRSHQVVAHKPVIPAVKPEDFHDHDLTPTRNDVADSQSNQHATLKSSAESTLRHKVDLLERGKHSWQGVTDYTAILKKQEVVKGELLDEQTLSIKCRQKPFSVYLVWLAGDVGREVIYVEGKNNGKMIAHDGGWKSRIPAFSLETDGWMAMRDARHPVTSAGLMGLIEIMVGIHQNDLTQSNFASCEIDKQQQFDGRPCSMFTTKYTSAKDSPIYRKSITWIDCEWNVPLQSKHFEWPRAGTTLAEAEIDQETIIESYSFTEIKLGCNLTDRDFDRTNQDYHFR